MLKRDPQPEIKRLEELALLVKAGDIKLPRFQRPFVWSRQEMLKLLDSIYNGYPIGSLLMWTSSQPLSSERSILGLAVNVDNFSSYPTNYLLDGQQRLTTICGALFWDGSGANSLWDICFDLEKEEFVHAKGDRPLSFFPLNKLINTGDFIRQCVRFENQEKGSIYTSRAEQLLRAFKDYKIAVVKIGDMTVEEVAPIFERINSTGRKLTMVDLMMAATWKGGFDLNAAIGEILQDAKQAGFGEIKDQVVLRSIAASAGLGINKEDIQRLRKLTGDELTTAALQTKRAVRNAMEFLFHRLKVRDFSKLPYALHFTYLVEYFRLSQRDPLREDELAKWMWFTSATRAFTSANSGQIARELGLIRSFAMGEREQLHPRQRIDISNFLFDKFNLRHSSSTAFAMLLGEQMPRETVDGNAVDLLYLRVKHSKFYSSLIEGDERNIAKVIHPYASAPARIEPQLAESHLLDERCIEYFVNGNYEELFTTRAALIGTRLQELTGCEITYSRPELETEIEEDADEAQDEMI